MKILVFGSLNIDFVMQVDHIIIPGETLKIDQMQVFPGGKGLNQAAAIARAGFPVVMAGNVGQMDGRLLLDLMDDYGIDYSQVRSLPGISGAAYIQVDSAAQNCILIASNANGQNDKDSIEAVISQFSAGDILLLQNEVNLLDHIIRAAHMRGMRIYLNPSPYHENLQRSPLEWVDGFIFNEVEGEQMTGHKSSDAIMGAMYDRFPDAELLLTLGAQGAVLKTRDDTIFQPAYKVVPVDTTAAGDTFTGYFLAEKARGTAPQTALDRAAKAAAIATTRQGAASSIPSLEEVLKADLEFKQ